ncbi:FKBP-type peptidyl-prolyl cis-trans isomerase FkpA precursor [Enhygromyxa salina]|uniref:Peptidyl-prolyl cis-trans isomerase n=1 Tax=Enhygromyxa salina TaxID=215803 RepID=A0A0C2CVU3_9BACT|nr:FKBP-type peptidyl-prolyl cis-trans isomerase [Enhygromyxa salina]KIG15191.1 FKBP-type peptidyl-prolyl cis-trans isomerase FkpA precursor [Enhygromyxa salina]
MRGLNLVAVVALASALSSGLACAPRVAAELGTPEPKPEDVEPLVVEALTTPAPLAVTTGPAPEARVPPPPAYPGFPADPIRSEVLPDGLVLHDYTPGSGAPALPGNRVSIHYVGQLLDGTEFDSTYARATPFEIELGLGRMIPGMERGLEGVRAGMRRTLVIPPALAYGERAPGTIPANATLVFFVEVLSVEPRPPRP